MWHSLAARTRTSSNRPRVSRPRQAFRPGLDALEGRALLSIVFDSVLDVGNDTAGLLSRSVAVDAVGNTYMTGRFSGTVDFDPNVVRPDGSDIFDSAGTNVGFIAKYAPDNSLVWARQVGIMGRGVAVDGAGNVHVSGDFSGQTAFGSTTLTAAGASDAFVTKLDPNGNFLWARSWGGSTTGEYGAAIALDPAGNVFTASDSWNQAGNGIGFDIRKYSATGAVTWAKHYNSAPGAAEALTTDAAGNVYVAGMFSGILDFDPDARKTYYVTGGPDVNGFVLKLTGAGGFSSVAPFLSLGPKGSSGVHPMTLAVDAAGNIVVGGLYVGQDDFNPNPKVVTALPNFNIDVMNGFVARLSPTGSLQWATPLGSGPVSSLAVDASGSVYATGSFQPSFVPGFGLPSVTSQGGSDIYLAKLTANGAVDWAVTFGGTGNDFAGAVAVDTAGNIYLAASYGSPTIDVDPDPIGTTTLTNPRAYNLFLLKLKQH